MPKVYLTDRQRTCDRVGWNLRTLKAGKSNTYMGGVIGASGETFRKRLNAPGTLTLDEIISLCKKFDISVDELVNEILEIRGRI